MLLCYHKESFGPIEQCFIPANDLIIQRGIGVFELIRTYGKHTFAMGQHLDRLAESAKLAGIEADEILKALPAVIDAGLSHPDAPQGDVLVKPYLTGGPVNACGYFTSPDFFVLFDTVHRVSQDEMRKDVVLAPNAIDRPFPLIKSTSYLTGFIPMRDSGPQVFESLYCCGGEITESLTSSFYLLLDGKLVTAPVGRVLRGVTREIILTLACENGFQVEERCPLLSELPQAQEVFISGSVKEVLPVVQVGAQKIGLGKPGPATQHIHKLFLSNIDRWLDK